MKRRALLTATLLAVSSSVFAQAASAPSSPAKKELAGWLESPVVRRYQQLAPEMEKALGEKLVAETRSTIEPKVEALRQNISNRLNAAAPAATPPAPKASAAKK